MSDKIDNIIPSKHNVSRNYDIKNNVKSDDIEINHDVSENIKCGDLVKHKNELDQQSQFAWVSMKSESKINEMSVKFDNNDLKRDTFTVPIKPTKRDVDSLSDIKIQLNAILPLTSSEHNVQSPCPASERVIEATQQIEREGANVITDNIINNRQINIDYIESQTGEQLIDFESKISFESGSEEDDELKPLIIDNHNAINAYIDQVEVENNNFNVDSNTSDTNSRHVEESCKNEDIGRLTFNCNPDRIYNNVVRATDPVNPEKDSKMGHETNESHCDKSEEFEINTIHECDVPNDKFSEEIVEQVEFYFSNESILKDAFLLKHVRRNKEGFVSLKLVSSFKRVRQLTKDWRVVGHAIRKKGKHIELNDICTKVRRIDPLPNFDETMPSRTIVACNLPLDKLTIEKVSEIFSPCGEIALIRILKPGMIIPADVRQFMNKYPEMQEKECALVEFIESNAARNSRNMPGIYEVYEMVAPKKKTGKKTTEISKMVENYKFSDENFERGRGGSFSIAHHDNDVRFKPRKNSDFQPKCDPYHEGQQKYSFNNDNHSQQYIYQPSYTSSRNSSFLQGEHHSSNNYYNQFSPVIRRYSNSSVASSEIFDGPRRYSGCSEGYSSCGEYSRRQSAYSNSDESRRNSGCSEYCPCSRRLSQCSDLIRRMPHNPEISNRRGSNGLCYQFDRSYSYPSEPTGTRRVSLDSDCGRKLSTGSASSVVNIPRNSGEYHDNYQHYRKFSNEFNSGRKMSNEHIFNGRRTSTDSGYDRKFSLGSDVEYGSPRSRTNSFLTCQHKSAENVIRTPIGPDGSIGFSSRTRKFGQTVHPVN